MKTSFTFFCLLAILSQPLLANEALAKSSETSRHFRGFPLILRLDGIGEIYGAAAGIQGIGKPEFDVYVGASMGDVEANIFSISDFDLRLSTFNYQFINLDEFSMDTQYARSTDSGAVFRQMLSGSAHHFGFERAMEREDMVAQVDLLLSDIVFEGFLDSQGKEVVINKTGLHDVSSTILRFSLNFDSREQAYFSEGVQVKNALALTTGRTGQSDQGQWDYQFSRHVFLSDKVLLSAYLKGSHSFIVSEASDYMSEADIRAELDAQCAGLPLEQQSSCSELENALVSYVLASNKYGTAAAVGGGYGLRSYGEQFFRGANAWVEGFEFEYRLPSFKGFRGKSRSLHLVAFAESAQLNDELADLFDDSQHSVGVGVRTYAKDLVVRLETAHGENGNAWNFRVGMPY